MYQLEITKIKCIKESWSLFGWGSDELLLSFVIKMGDNITKKRLRIDGFDSGVSKQVNEVLYLGNLDQIYLFSLLGVEVDLDSEANKVISSFENKVDVVFKGIQYPFNLWIPFWIIVFISITLGVAVMSLIVSVILASFLSLSLILYKFVFGWISPEVLINEHSSYNSRVLSSYMSNIVSSNSLHHTQDSNEDISISNRFSYSTKREFIEEKTYVSRKEKSIYRISFKHTFQDVPIL